MVITKESLANNICKCQTNILSILFIVLASSTVQAESKTTHINFDHGHGSLPVSWQAKSGLWQIKEGALVADARSEEACIVWNDNDVKNVLIEVDVTFLQVNDPKRWLAVTFRGGKPEPELWSQVPIRFETTASNGTEFAVRKANQWQVRRRGPAAHDSILGSSRHLSVMVRGHNIQATLDNEVVIQSAFCVENTSGLLGLRANGCVAAFDNLTITRLPDTTPPAFNNLFKACQIVAHRGFSSQAPENTLSACRAAVDAGIDGVEFDVRRSKDMVPVLLHDSTLDRTTDGKGKVVDTPLSELKQLDAGTWKHARYANEPIPTLHETLSYLSTTPCLAVIDLKDSNIAFQTLASVTSTGTLANTCVITGDKELLSLLHTHTPDLSTAWLCYDLPRHLVNADQQTPWIVEQLEQARTQILDINVGLLSPELIAQLAKHNITVWVWTVNDPDVARALMSWGVSAITTDCPDLIKQVRRKLISTTSR